MSNFRNVNKNLNEAKKTVLSVVSIISVALPIMEEISDRLANRSNYVKVPELYPDGFPLNLDEAIKILNRAGLESSTSLAKANSVYKDCFDSQVVDSSPKEKQKVPQGTTIILKYVTSEVIAESQKMFEEEQRLKAESKLQKEQRNDERREQALEFVISAKNKLVHRKKDE